MARTVTRARPVSARIDSTVPVTHTRPLASTTMREAVASASSSRCVVNSTAPPSATYSSRTSQSARRPSTSRPAVGSSRKSAAGPARECEPPGPDVYAVRRTDHPPAAVQGTSGRVSRAASRRRAADRGAPERDRRAPRREASTGSRRAAGRRRCRGVPQCRGVAAEDSALPRSGRRRPSMIASAVDLPAPFGPSSPSTSPARSSSETPSSATVDPKLRCTSIRRAAGRSLRAAARWRLWLRGSLFPTVAVDRRAAGRRCRLAETDRCGEQGEADEDVVRARARRSRRPAARSLCTRDRTPCR